MSPDRLETYLQQLEPPPALDAGALERWRADARRQLLALAAAYEELGHGPEEALQSALRQLQASPRSPATHDHFPTLRAAGRRARAFGRWIVPAAVAVLLRLVPVTGVALLFLILGSLVGNVIAGRALERELTAIRARGEPLSLREAAPPEVPDAENAAVVYAEAFQLLDRVEPVTRSRGQKRLGDVQEKALREFLAAKGVSASAASVPTVRALLDEAAPALERARVAAAMPRCRFPVNWEDGAGALFPHYAPLRLLSRLLAAHAITEAQEEHVAAAVADLTAIVGIARHAGGEPLLIGQLIQYACLGNALDALDRVMECATLTEAQSRQINELLAALELYGPFERAMQTERCGGMWAFDFARREPARLAQLLGSESNPYPVLLPRLWLVGKPLLTMDEGLYLRRMRQRIVLAGERRHIGLREWEKDSQRLPWYAGMTKIFLPFFEHAADRRDETLARLSLARWALALHLYRQHAGRYPARAEEAAQTLRGALPTDPFTGRAFHYRRQGDGYLMYSFGANGRDDGGRDERDRPRPHPVLSRFPPRPDRQYDDVAWRVRD
jgi:hypothetical protein